MNTPPPRRLRRSRAKGWRKPLGAIIVTRGTPWGNPFPASSDAVVWMSVAIGGKGNVDADLRCAAVLLYRWWLDGGKPDDLPLLVRVNLPEELPTPPSREEIVCELRGRDLVCWCPLPDPGEVDHCHARVLLEIANKAIVHNLSTT